MMSEPSDKTNQNDADECEQSEPRKPSKKIDLTDEEYDLGSLQEFADDSGTSLSSVQFAHGRAGSQDDEALHVLMWRCVKCGWTDARAETVIVRKCPKCGQSGRTGITYRSIYGKAGCVVTLLEESL